MEFWGAEVKVGQPLKVQPDEECLIHVSQASLGKGKKGESVLLYVTVDGKKLVIGTLSHGSIPQISFDLVFEKEFELSHSSSEASVHFVGYRSPNLDEEEEDYSSEEEEDDVVPAPVTAAVVKPDSEPKPKPAEVKTAEVKPESDESDESDSEDDSGDDGSDSEKGMEVDEDDSDDSDEDDSEEEEEETPKQPEPINKKRVNESASKAPVSAKNAKPAVAVTPQKTEEKKKNGHSATPHPAKKGGGKSPVNANQSPKFGGGQSSGGSNKKQFNSGKQFGSNNKGKGKGKGRA